MLGFKSTARSRMLPYFRSLGVIGLLLSMYLWYELGERGLNADATQTSGALTDLEFVLIVVAIASLIIAGIAEFRSGHLTARKMAIGLTVFGAAIILTTAMGPYGIILAGVASVMTMLIRADWKMKRQ